ncbi:hypothetical protein ADH76_12865 [Enterocloster clostridioformis]|uniref:hypothetical protein n=1 Tax=Enterocloster clostridioformis TaxID=1531 RepID=UPI000B91ED84|nr:hypothetical protein [Enterocloster clostridioformis]NDO29669.1 hypothetical protein [Enterocloster clostridioformis]OXE69250.1 hypothetical protein ADH76_12865 [Enterocloster clostridioformis]QQR03069.1 hypothetical protein I5Q83_13040 [Enterocloster clostridioformis]
MATAKEAGLTTEEVAEKLGLEQPSKIKPIVPIMFSFRRKQKSGACMLLHHFGGIQAPLLLSVL